MKENNKIWLRYIICFGLIAILCYLFPYTGDDWAWGSKIGIDRLNNWFENYNGRYVGNLIVLAMTRSNLLKAVIMSFCLTGIVALCEYIFKRKNTYYENGLHLLSVFIRSCSLDFAYFYSVFLCFCNLVLSELWFLIISYPGQRYEIFISLYVFYLKKFILHSFLTIQTCRLLTSIRQYQTFEPF